MTTSRSTLILGIVIIALSLSARVAQGQQVPDDPPDTQFPDDPPFTQLPGDQFDPEALPGDQFDPQALPGDQFDPQALPGDQFDPQALPGDQFDPQALPGDQFDPQALPGDQFDASSLPGDQFSPGSAPTQQLLLHLPLDGSLRHSGQTGSARFVTADGTPAPTFVPGHTGQALSFNGPAAVAAPFNLDHSRYPRVTVTAWVREQAGASGSRDIFSSTSTAGARVGIHGGRLAARLGGRGVAYGHAKFPVGEWAFVAAVLDTAAGSAQLYQNDDEPFIVEGIDVSTKAPPLVSDPDDPSSEPQAWIVIGASNFETFSTSSRPLIIDDVRVYGGALSAEQVADLRRAVESSAAGPTTGVDLDPDGRSRMASQVPGEIASRDLVEAGAIDTLLDSAGFSETWQASACETPDDCPIGSYCGVDQLCHPDRHRPLPDIQIGSGEYQVSAGYTLPTANSNEVEQPETTIPHPSGVKRYSGVTGTLGDIINEIEFLGGSNYSEPFNKAWLSGISWREKLDRPCFVEIRGLLPVFDEYQDKGVHRLWEKNTQVDGCAGGSDDGGDTNLNQGGPSPQSGGDASVVNRIQVCHNDRDNRRMKGLRIYGSKIGRDGGIIQENNADATELPNCRHWAPAVICPADTMATGLVIHATEASGTNQQIVGLQLICREISIML